jgi:hypothetical protein
MKTKIKLVLITAIAIALLVLSGCSIGNYFKADFNYQPETPSLANVEIRNNTVTSSNEIQSEIFITDLDQALASGNRSLNEVTINLELPLASEINKVEISPIEGFSFGAIGQSYDGVGTGDTWYEFEIGKDRRVIPVISELDVALGDLVGTEIQIANIRFTYINNIINTEIQYNADMKLSDNRVESLSGGKLLIEPVTAPYIMDISTTSPDGKYFTNQTINEILFVFSAPMTGTGVAHFLTGTSPLGTCELNPVTSSGIPLETESGSLGSEAGNDPQELESANGEEGYKALSSTGYTEYRCNYTVQALDRTDDLSVSHVSGLIDGVTKLELSGEIMKNLNDNHELQLNPIHIIDVNSKVTPDGTYYTGDTIQNIEFVFSEEVSTTGAVATFDTGGTCEIGFTTNFVTGSCNYTVSLGEQSPDLNVVSISGITSELTGEDLNQYFVTNLADNRDYVINGADNPYTLNISTNSANGPYYTDQIINNISFEFSEEVSLIAGSQAIAYFKTGDYGTTPLNSCQLTQPTQGVTWTCNLTVGLDDRSNDLSVHSIYGLKSDTSNLPLAPFQILRNLDFNNDLYINPFHVINIDGTSINGDFYPGDIVEGISIEFSEPIDTSMGIINGLVAAVFDTGTGCQLISIDDFTAGCDYTVQPGDESPDLTVTEIPNMAIDDPYNPAQPFYLTDYIARNLDDNKDYVIHPALPYSNGNVYVDINGNGDYDGDDINIGNVNIEVYDQGNALIASTYTVNGEYLFTNLTPNTNYSFYAIPNSATPEKNIQYSERDDISKAYNVMSDADGVINANIPLYTANLQKSTSTNQIINLADVLDIFGPPWQQSGPNRGDMNYSGFTNLADALELFADRFWQKTWQE